MNKIKSSITHTAKTGYRKHNNQLITKRTESTVSINGFPMEIRTKPTAHTQYCFACRELINKGQRQIKLDYGMWYISSGMARACFGKISGKDAGKYFSRHIYLHGACFSCLLKKMFVKAKLTLNPNCETCDMRFNCYTGNINIDDLDEQPHYIPSRPCKRVDSNVGMIGN